MTELPADLARRDELLRQARQAIESDNLAYAEALAQEIIALEPEDGVAWAIRAHIAGLINMEAKAVNWGGRANPNVLAESLRYNPSHRSGFAKNAQDLQPWETFRSSR